jgi:hypothetical protein
MTQISKRDVLFALAALGLGAASTARAQNVDAIAGIDVSAGREIGEAYLAARPGGNVEMLRASRLPNGFNEGAIAGLRARVASDFQRGAVFVHKGWRLAETEAQLFALLTTAA